MTDIAFTDLPFETQLRLAAVAVVQAAATIAGGNVRNTTLDALNPADDFPVVTLMTEVDRTGMSLAGGIPQFAVAITLQIGCGVIAADPGQCVTLNDVLAQQVRIALFCDPVMMRLLGAIESISIQQSRGKTDRYIGTMEMKIALKAKRPGEQYTPNTTSVLLATGEPQAQPRTMIDQVTKITGAVRLPSQPETPVADLTQIKTQTFGS